jgi:hypothetical protein
LELEAKAKGQHLEFGSSKDEQPVRQIAKDVRVVRNLEIVSLVAKSIPGVFVLWLIYLMIR